MPDSTSALRKRFRERNSGVVSSSFRAPSQLSCRVLISRARSSRCSGVSLASQASLSNFTGSVVGAVAEEAGADGEDDGAVPFVFALGWPKNAVMELLALGFFAASVARSAALRLSDILPL